MDYVVSVDSAPIHFAGAMGASGYVLLNKHVTDWRWGCRFPNQELYPTIRAVRQNENQTYGQLIEWVRRDIEKKESRFQYV